MMHDFIERIKFRIEYEYHTMKPHLPEITKWLLFAACLAALTFVLGVSVGFIVGE